MTLMLICVSRQALVEAQSRLQEEIQGFHFNLGFSGKFFHRGTDLENKGDDMLLGRYCMLVKSRGCSMRVLNTG